MPVSIAIITATLNSEEHIGTCLESLHRQSVRPIQVLVDGGSSDGTLAIAKPFHRPGDIMLSEPDHGIYDALNKGIARTKAEVIGVLHADDFYAHQGVIEKVAQAFGDESVDAVYGDLDYVDRQTPEKVVRRWRSGDFKSEKFYWGWMPPHPAFFVRSKFFDQLGGYRLDLGTSADYELMLRFLLVNKLRATYLPGVLVKMRTGGASNVSLTARWNANRMDRQAWRVNELQPRPWTLVAKPLSKFGQWIKSS